MTPFLKGGKAGFSTDNHWTPSFLILVCICVLTGCNRTSEQAASMAALSNAVMKSEQHTTALEKRVEKLEWTALFDEIDKQKKFRAKLNPAGGGYVRLESDCGVLLVSVDNMEPYLDGYRITLEIGNPSLATYDGFEATAYWGPRMKDISKATDEFGGIAVDELSKWESLQHTNSFAVPDKLLPRAWNYVRFVLAPAKATEIRELELSIETKRVSLGQGAKPKD